MSKTPVSRLKAGMKLSSNLQNEKGAFLLPKGTILTEAHIANLRRWEVVEAEVELAAAAGIEEQPAAVPAAGGARKSKVPPETIAAAKGYALKRFKKTDLRDEIMREVFRLAVAHKAKDMFLHNQETTADPCPKLTAAEIAAAKEQLPPPPQLSDLISSHDEVMSLPSVLAKVNTVVQNPMSTPEECAEVIALDPGLSSKLLRLVNSSYYGFVAKVDTLSRAVTIIGSKQLTTLALGVSVTSMFRGVPGDLLDLRAFWKHSVACAIIAGTLATMIDKNTAERAFVSGLLHDIGTLAMIAGQSRHCRKAYCLAKIQSRLIHETENDVFGYDHAKVGAALMASWRLPSSLESAVRQHHYPTDSAQREACLIHVADILAHALEIGASAECLVPQIAPDAWQRIGLPKEAVAKAALLADQQIEDTLNAFLPDNSAKK